MTGRPNPRMKLLGNDTSNANERLLDDKRLSTDNQNNEKIIKEIGQTLAKIGDRLYAGHFQTWRETRRDTLPKDVLNDLTVIVFVTVISGCWDILR